MKDTIENELTDDQLWELCIEDEKRKRYVENDHRDKGIDWNYESFIYERSKGLK